MKQNRTFQFIRRHLTETEKLQNQMLHGIETSNERSLNIAILLMLTCIQSHVIKGALELQDLLYRLRC